MRICPLTPNECEALAALARESYASAFGQCMTVDDMEGVLAGLTAAMFKTALRTDTVLGAYCEAKLHAKPQPDGDALTSLELACVTFPPRHTRLPVTAQALGRGASDAPGSQRQPCPMPATPMLAGFAQTGPASISMKAAAGIAQHHPALELRRLYVTPSRQGEGIGTDLLDAALKASADQPVLLDVWARNTHAMHLYRSRGFITVAEHYPVFACGPARDADLIMLHPGAV